MQASGQNDLISFRHVLRLVTLTDKMAFDPNKKTEVEGMTAVEFGVWKSAKHTEVIILITDKFDTLF